jgi:hypothetical protein
MPVHDDCQLSRASHLQVNGVHLVHAKGSIEGLIEEVVRSQDTSRKHDTEEDTDQDTDQDTDEAAQEVVSWPYLQDRRY